MENRAKSVVLCSYKKIFLQVDCPVLNLICLHFVDTNKKYPSLICRNIFVKLTAIKQPLRCHKPLQFFFLRWVQLKNIFHSSLLVLRIAITLSGKSETDQIISSKFFQSFVFCSENHIKNKCYCPSLAFWFIPICDGNHNFDHFSLINCFNSTICIWF